MNPGQQKYLIVVGGPTASGKTDVAIQLALHFNTEIISCDSRQFYRQMTIGTAKPTQAQLESVKHHFIGHLDIEKAYSIGEFEQDALQALELIFKDRDIAVAVGGSGMYLKALCEGLDEFPEIPEAIAQALKTSFEQGGLAALQQELLVSDPDYYHQVDLSNPSRLMRALAVCRASGQPFSSFRLGEKPPRFFKCIYLQLVWPRASLYERINARVVQMMSDGLLEEAQRLLPYSHCNALQTVGYQELFSFFEKKTNLEGAVALIQQNSRRYAKRQLTWMRRDGYWKKIRPTEIDLAIAYIEQVIKRAGPLIRQLTSWSAPGAPRLSAMPPDAWIVWEQPGPASPALSIPIWKMRDSAYLGPLLPEQADMPTTALEMLFHEAMLWPETEEIWVYEKQTLAPIFEKLHFKNHPKIKMPPEWVKLPAEEYELWQIKPFDF